MVSYRHRYVFRGEGGFRHIVSIVMVYKKLGNSEVILLHKFQTLITFYVFTFVNVDYQVHNVLSKCPLSIFETFGHKRGPYERKSS